MYLPSRALWILSKMLKKLFLLFGLLIGMYLDSSTNATITSSTTTNIKMPEAEQTSESTSTTPIHLVLRMRDEKRELQDIKFDYLPNKDTVDEISHELVNAKLIDAIDMIAVSANLNKLLQNHSLSPITFSLVSKKS